MGPIGCPKISVRNYHCSLCNNPEERISHLLYHGQPEIMHIQQTVYKSQIMTA